MDKAECDHPERILTAEALRCHGITFAEEIKALKTSNLPEHVNVLCEELLMFDKTLLRQDIVGLRLDKEELDDIPKTAYAERLRTIQLAKKGHKRDPNIEFALQLATEAETRSRNKAREAGWTELLINSVFKEKANGSDKSKYLELTDEIAIGEENIEWNESDRIRGLSKGAVTLKQPKPDIYLGFPIQDPRSANGFQRLDYFQNFTAGVLYDLSHHSLLSSPTSTFLREMSNRKGVTTEISDPSTTPDSIEAHHLLCFPWAIVEGKKENVNASKREYGRCQAANAASVSLSIMEKLVRYADVQYKGQHIPPVFAFTFVGPNVKLWVAYSDANNAGNQDHRMTCIWQASIRRFWGCFQLYHIVDKLYFWALRILKPQISGCIDQWRHRHIHETCMLRSILAQGKNWEISETVGRVESRLSTLGISKPRLEDLLSQIVIQKELLLQSKPAGSSADPPSDVSNNNGPPPSTAKQPSTLGKKNGYSKGCTPARSTRSGRKSAPENLIRSKWKPDSPFGPAIEDPSRPNSDTRTESNICLSSYLGDTSMPVKDRVHAFGQPIRTAAARPIPSLNLPANGNITASEASPGTLKLLPMRIYTPEESKLAGPLTPQYPVSASRNSFGGYPPWVLGDTPPRSCKGSLEETFHFGQPAADILDCSQKSIARPRTRPRSTSHVDRLKKLEGFTTEAASRAQNPITPPLRSPFQSVDCLSIPQEAPFGQISHGDLRVVRREGEGGEDWQRALEIPDSQSECFELDL